MFQRGALTFTELETILFYQREPTKSARFLLDLLIECPVRDVYDVFMESLKETQQNDVFALIFSEGWFDIFVQ